MHFVESCLALMNKFVMRSSGDPHPGPNSVSSEATYTPFTSLSANASGALGYLLAQA